VLLFPIAGLTLLRGAPNAASPDDTPEPLAAM
jgi:hypothetical protein